MKNGLFSRSFSVFEFVALLRSRIWVFLAFSIVPVVAAGLYVFKAPNLATKTIAIRIGSIDVGVPGRDGRVIEPGTWLAERIRKQINESPTKVELHSISVNNNEVRVEVRGSDTESLNSVLGQVEFTTRERHEQILAAVKRPLMTQADFLQAQTVDLKALLDRTLPMTRGLGPNSAIIAIQRANLSLQLNAAQTQLAQIRERLQSNTFSMTEVIPSAPTVAPKYARSAVLALGLLVGLVAGLTAVILSESSPALLRRRSQQLS